MAFGKPSPAYTQVESLPTPQEIDLGDLRPPAHGTVELTDVSGDDNKESLGVAVHKPFVEVYDIATLAVSMLAGAFAIACIQNNYLAWHLGTRNYQLVLVGFLLSVENLCLNFVAPTVFLQWEARFGSSTLQNYDGLLRKAAFASRLDAWWRIILLITTALPLGLSAAYKQFNSGHSTTSIHNGTQQFGMYAPHGLEQPSSTGTMYMYNATIPFLQATYDVPPLPQWPQPYGYNTLLLNGSSTAVLDLPNSSFVSSVQSQLQLGEVWNVTARVYATISTANTTIEQHRDEDQTSDFWHPFAIADKVQATDFGYNVSVGMLSNFDVMWSRDQSWLFLGIFPSPPSDNGTNMTTFISTASYYNTIRAPCNGTWRISTSGMDLVDGKCFTSVDPSTIDRQYVPDYQLPLINNQLNLQDRYKDIIYDIFGRFSDKKYATWLGPTQATMVASMMWSRLTANNGPSDARGVGALYDWQVPNVGQNKSVVPEPTWYNATIDDVGLRYSRDDTVITSTRITLSRSGWLFFVCVFQPIIQLALMCSTYFLYNVPIARGFNTIALLAGLDSETKESLRGAAFSGELSRKVRIAIDTGEVGYQTGEVRYRTKGDGDVVQKTESRVRKGWKYG